MLEKMMGKQKKQRHFCAAANSSIPKNYFFDGTSQVNVSSEV